MDSPTTDRVKFDGTAAEEKVSDILEAISQASARTISGLKTTLKPQSLHRAVGLLDRAGETCIIGNGDTFPVAALLTNGLNDRGRVCKIFGPYGSVMEHEILSLGPGDLLVLIELPGDRLPENILTDARARKVPILAIAEAAAHSKAGYCQVRLPVPKTRVFGMPALAGHMAVAQLLLIALDRYRSATD